MKNNKQFQISNYSKKISNKRLLIFKILSKNKKNSLKIKQKTIKIYAKLYNNKEKIQNLYKIKMITIKMS